MEEHTTGRDLRAVALGAAAWAGGLLVLLVPGRLALACAFGALVLGGGVARRRPALRRSLAAWLLVAVAVASVAALRSASVEQSPVAELAERRTAVEVRLRVVSDPVPFQAGYGGGVRLRVVLLEVSAAGATSREHAPVLVFADDSWAAVPLGAELRTAGRLAPARDDRTAGLLSVTGPPEQVAAPGVLWRAAGAVRHGVRAAVADRPAPARDLVPALVDGDDAGLSAAVQEDFRATGMTHLLAVSGTNLTLVVGFLMLIGSRLGVRGRGRLVLGACGIAGFVLVARTEPSVVRAAAMGAVALLALGSGARDRGPRALGWAVVVLLFLDPGLAVSAGFALSVLACAGILFLAPGWTRALAGWMPGWLAAAIAVPAAAQLACTPVVAAISGQVSLVAVAANLLAGPLVAPATVAGLLGGLLHLLWPPLAVVPGWVATTAAGGIIAVGTAGAGIATPALDWGTGPLALLVLVLCCAVGGALTRPVFARRTPTLCCAGLLGVGVLVPLPTPGWPPDGWVMLACDVGQGDALALNAGNGSAVVVDAGPDPDLVDRCLDRLGVERVPLVVLTHFHADHVDGLAGVYAGRPVGDVEVTALAAPAERVAAVDRLVPGALAVPAYGSTRRVGDVVLQVLGPPPGTIRDGPVGDEGSDPNNASVVLLVEVRGVRLLLTGDMEPEVQRRFAASMPGLQVDVLKVPHHGSRHQDLPWLLSLGARLAVISVGEGNDYGHPAPELLDALAQAGIQVTRTDRDGDIAVVAGPDGLRVGTGP